jgi:hypothetical protein
MTTSRPIDRALEREREDLEALLADVLVSVLSEEAEVLGTGSTPDAALDGAPGAVLGIRDPRDDSHLGVQVRVSAALAEQLTARMMATAEPGRDDLLDAVGEFGNIAGGQVKSLLLPSARLSLPSATLDSAGLPPAREGSAEPTVIHASVLGEPVELALVPHVVGDGLLWPPAEAPSEELQEAQS